MNKTFIDDLYFKQKRQHKLSNVHYFIHDFIVKSFHVPFYTYHYKRLVSILSMKLHIITKKTRLNRLEKIFMELIKNVHSLRRYLSLPTHMNAKFLFRFLLVITKILLTVFQCLAVSFFLLKHGQLFALRKILNLISNFSLNVRLASQNKKRHARKKKN